MNDAREKVLLMGRSYAGKTSMRSIIFANYVPRDTATLGATVSVEHSQVRFLGDITLNIWDCGGQDGFMERYLGAPASAAVPASQHAGWAGENGASAGAPASLSSPLAFSLSSSSASSLTASMSNAAAASASSRSMFDDVKVLIYVFDVASRETDRDMAYFTRACTALRANSPSACVFALLHKMDLAPEAQRASLFGSMSARVTKAAESLRTTCCATSIWNESLYEAWSAIVCSFVPNRDALQRSLASFCNACDADEVVLFERATFLVIASARRRRRRRRARAATRAPRVDDANFGSAAPGDDRAGASSRCGDRSARAHSASSRERDGHAKRRSAGGANATEDDGSVNNGDRSDDDDDDDDVDALDIHRFEKVSNIVKQFKLSCLKSSTQFRSLEMRSDDLVAVLDSFTSYTSAMVVATADDDDGGGGGGGDDSDGDGSTARNANSGLQQDETTARDSHDAMDKHADDSKDNGDNSDSVDGAGADGNGTNAALLRLNIRAARPHFANLLAMGES